MIEAQTPYSHLVGIDWGSETHQVCVVDAAGRVMGERKVRHTGQALTALGDWLEEQSEGDVSRTAVAIEVPRGPIVDALVERGFAVYAINPKQLDRFRDRHTVAGAKDDRRDAYVLADSLRTDRKCFRRVSADTPEIVELRELTHVEGELKGELRRQTNRLREQLLRYFPQVLGLCNGADEAWIWDLLELIPTPKKARQVKAKQLQQLLKAHRIRRITARQAIAELRRKPLKLIPGAAEAAGKHVGYLLPRIKLAHAQLRQCRQDIEQALEQLPSDNEAERGEHRDVDILLSSPGLGRTTAATMLAEAHQVLRSKDYHALRSLCGAAPVTVQSGKRRVISMRYACNHRLRNAVHHWTRVAISCDPQAATHYQQLRARGHGFARALRGVADRRLKALIAMLRDRTIYDPQRRPAGTDRQKAA